MAHELKDVKLCIEFEEFMNMRDTYRSDEKPEVKVFFQVCSDKKECGWTDDESSDNEDDACVREECPDCGSDLEVESDYV